MHKTLLLITLFAFSVAAQDTPQDVDVKNLTDQQIRFQVFSFKSGMRWQETLDFCNSVLKQKPLNLESHFGKGRALAKLNKDEGAIKSNRRVI